MEVRWWGTRTKRATGAKRKRILEQHWCHDDDDDCGGNNLCELEARTQESRREQRDGVEIEERAAN